MSIENRTNILYKLLLVAIVVSPFNLNIYSIRLLDVVLLAIIYLGIPMIKTNTKNFKFSLLFFFIFIISIVMGILFSDNIFYISRGLFIYKYLLPFLLICILYSVSFNLNQINLFVKFLFYVYIFLVFWVFVDTLWHSLGSNNNIAYRPAMPFRDHPYHSDAHLYSTYLSIGLIFFIGLYEKLSIRNYFKIPFIAVSLIALIMTGSKTGILILFISLLLLLPIIKKKYILYMIIGVSITYILVYILDNLNIVNTNIINSFIHMFNRSINYDFVNNISTNPRIVNMNIGIKDTYIFNYLIGIGIFKSTLTWHDSLIGILFSHVGLIGLIIFTYLLFLLTFNNKKFFDINTKVYYYLFVVLLICYLVANIITEYFLVSRSVFPVVFFLVILYHYMRLEYHIKNRGQNYQTK